MEDVITPPPPCVSASGLLWKRKKGKTNHGISRKITDTMKVQVQKLIYTGGQLFSDRRLRIGHQMNR